MLDLARNISELEKATELLEEVIILNNASGSEYNELKHFISVNPQIPFRYYDAPENLGVAKGRNYAIRKANAPYIIMLDDDAVLQTNDTLVKLLYLFDQKKDGRPVSIISFKVLYHATGEMQVNAFPHKQFKALKHESSFETYYYAGGAHAIKKEVIEKLGYYPADFFYGMEEYDLGYRILNNGYSIIYTDEIVMLHKESPLGRKTQKEKLMMMWVNKSKVAYRYLPKKYFWSTAFMWSLQYLKKTGFHFPGWIKGWKQIREMERNETRQMVSNETLRYLKKIKARLAY